MKVAHIYASKAVKNSGDFLIGPATKSRFREIVRNDNITFVNFDVRSEFNKSVIDKINKEFDAIIVGSGGLILPDTKAAAGSPSGWQWRIADTDMNRIKIPIYVISIGYNTFFEQRMGMVNKNSNVFSRSKYNAFVRSIKLLVEKSTYFSMRHSRDIEKLLNDIGESYRNKISFEYCPTIKYTRDKGLKSTGNIIAFEIKDDRLWRRCYKIGKDKFYSELTKAVKHFLDKGFKVICLSHDGSNMFHNYLKRRGIHVPMILNSVANEDKIYSNYCSLSTIICTAGHSQMISSAIDGLNVISLITHPKLINFCRDTGDTNYVMPNKDYNFSDDLIKKIINVEK